MIDFTQVEEVELDGELVEKIEINDVVVWENIKSVTLTDLVNNEAWGLNNSLYLEVLPQKQYSVDLYDENDNLIESVETDEFGTYNFTLTQESPQTIGYYAKVKRKTSDIVNLTWNKRNILVNQKSKGTHYYNHIVRMEYLDEIDNTPIPNIISNLNISETGNSWTLTSNENGYTNFNITSGNNYDTTAKTFTLNYSIQENELYNVQSFTKSISYQSSIGVTGVPTSRANASSVTGGRMMWTDGTTGHTASSYLNKIDLASTSGYLLNSNLDYPLRTNDAPVGLTLKTWTNLTNIPSTATLTSAKLTVSAKNVNGTSGGKTTAKIGACSVSGTVSLTGSAPEYKTDGTQAYTNVFNAKATGLTLSQIRSLSLTLKFAKNTGSYVGRLAVRQCFIKATYIPAQTFS